MPISRPVTTQKGTQMMISPSVSMALSHTPKTASARKLSPHRAASLRPPAMYPR